jgi:hypothetical protein
MPTQREKIIKKAYEILKKLLDGLKYNYDTTNYN